MSANFVAYGIQGLPGIYVNGPPSQRSQMWCVFVV